MVLPSGDYTHLTLTIGVDISGSYMLFPQPDIGIQDYRVELYLSLDDDISTQVDLKVLFCAEYLAGHIYAIRSL